MYMGHVSIVSTAYYLRWIPQLAAAAIRTDPPHQVRLHGKGGKTRLRPIWPQTAQLLQELSNNVAHSGGSDSPQFVNRQGKLTRFGVRYLLKKHIRSRSQGNPHAAGEADPSPFLAAYDRHLSPEGGGRLRDH
ncbi:hypothetical protein [Bradyrhizobium zhanjiangense]|uniref:hypothetical protein n=1 Tax=Bradyrhizobium zhanjiangense TaxID=1325107 RepID=UPI001FDECFCF|nr:hypothetical protein [Bradyrhizobium zhanjiangense]